MNTLNEYDLRQILLIKKKIDLCENKKIDLFDFVCDVGGLLNSLESVDNTWKDTFQTEINTLEMIYDSIEDGSIVKWKKNHKEVTRNSVLKLKEMVLFLLGNYLKFSDPNILESAIAAESNWLICPKCNEAWESNSINAMVICPKCERAFHNPFYELNMKKKFSNNKDNGLKNINFNL